MTNTIKGRIQVGDVLQDGPGVIWTVTYAKRIPPSSNAKITMESGDFMTRTIWENTLKARTSHWQRVTPVQTVQTITAVNTKI